MERRIEAAEVRLVLFGGGNKWGWRRVEKGEEKGGEQYQVRLVVAGGEKKERVCGAVSEVRLALSGRSVA